MFKSIFTFHRWQRIEYLMRNYEPDLYYDLDYDVQVVKSKEIIGLSLWPPEKLINDKKMDRLRKLVKLHGWNDPAPQSLHLCRLPNGKYTVCCGGNHRAILANELDIEKIKAYVTLVIPKSILTKSEISEIEAIFIERKDLLNKARDLTRLLNILCYPICECKDEEQKRDELTRKYNLLYDNIENILKEAATKKGLIPDSFK